MPRWCSDVYSTLEAETHLNASTMLGTVFTAGFPRSRVPESGHRYHGGRNEPLELLSRQRYFPRSVLIGDGKCSLGGGDATPAAINPDISH